MANVKIPTICSKTIFSLVARERCMRNLQNFAVPKTGKLPNQTASVLVPVCKIGEIPSLLYTVRAPHLRTNSGEVAFPGGKSDSGEDAIQTALRETYEEIGLDQSKIDVWGKGPEIPGRNNKIRITPVIGSITELKPEDLKINTEEVAEVFSIPITSLCEPQNQYYTQFSNGFILPVYVVENYKIWGITAYITHVFLSCVLTKDYYRNDWMKKKLKLEKLEKTVETES